MVSHEGSAKGLVVRWVRLAVGIDRPARFAKWSDGSAAPMLHRFAVHETSLHPHPHQAHRTQVVYMALVRRLRCFTIVWFIRTRRLAGCVSWVEQKHQNKEENPNFVDFHDLIPSFPVIKLLDLLYFHVEDVEGFAWVRKSPKSVEY
ncbi:hypothetical protein E3N88_13685 [Mikania micrantha]|uniref:Uncharacterized protein n=1 Tax=Mikania micrantha TaxID=192012 RepID=A0A5N6P2C5_9ASTR|nr:hypothetical protein E3N88_13685 [Mikania micrantha]